MLIKNTIVIEQSGYILQAIKRIISTRSICILNEPINNRIKITTTINLSLQNNFKSYNWQNPSTRRSYIVNFDPSRNRTKIDKTKTTSLGRCEYTRADFLSRDSFVRRAEAVKIYIVHIKITRVCMSTFTYTHACVHECEEDGYNNDKCARFPLASVRSHVRGLYRSRLWMKGRRSKPFFARCGRFFSGVCVCSWRLGVLMKFSFWEN